MARPADLPPKSRALAVLLSVVLPGAGLAYLGYWRAGGVNLVVALAVYGLAVALLAPEALVEYGPMIGSGVAGGSLGAAYTAYDRRAGKTPA